MDIDYRAFSWGIKAAQAGLLHTDNPYSSSDKRKSWTAGFQLAKETSKPNIH